MEKDPEELIDFRIRWKKELTERVDSSQRTCSLTDSSAVTVSQTVHGDGDDGRPSVSGIVSNSDTVGTNDIVPNSDTVGTHDHDLSHVPTSHRPNCADNLAGLGVSDNSATHFSCTLCDTQIDHKLIYESPIASANTSICHARGCTNMTRTNSDKPNKKDSTCNAKDCGHVVVTGRPRPISSCCENKEHPHQRQIDENATTMAPSTQASTHSHNACNFASHHSSPMPSLASTSQWTMQENHDHASKGKAGKIMLNTSPSHSHCTLEPFKIATSLLQGDSGIKALSSKRLDEIDVSKRFLPGNLQSSEIQSSLQKRRKLDASSSSDNSKNCEKKDTESKRFLDIFLADLTEINEIPFFELNLSREIAVHIFKNLDPQDLCRCSQVSKPWKSLAEDELIWSSICHRLGYEEDTLTSQKSGWKAIVRERVLRYRALQQNWKTRTGSVQQLQYVQGGILCAANSHERVAATGYTNGHVKVWDLQHFNDVTLTPSSTALVLDDAKETGTLTNYVTCVGVHGALCAAGYSQGILDIWKPEESLRPIFSRRLPGSVRDVCWNDRSSIIAATSSNHVTVFKKRDSGYNVDFEDEAEFIKVATMAFNDQAGPNVKMLPEEADRCQRTGRCDLAVSAGDKLQLHTDVGTPRASCTVLHDVMDSIVRCFKCTPNTIAAGITVYGLEHDNRVTLFDLTTGKEFQRLDNQAYATCVDVLQTTSTIIATGSSDTKIRVYDIRQSTPIMVVHGHAGHVTQIRVDDWKVISGGEDGLLCLWDQRVSAKVWEMHNRHPVRHIDFQDDLLLAANIPRVLFPETDDGESMVHRRYRGSIYAYDFSVNQATEGIPDICLSNYDEPEAYNYNIALAMPYDTV